MTKPIDEQIAFLSRRVHELDTLAKHLGDRIDNCTVAECHRLTAILESLNELKRLKAIDAVQVPNGEVFTCGSCGFPQMVKRSDYDTLRDLLADTQTKVVGLEKQVTMFADALALIDAVVADPQIAALIDAAMQNERKEL